MQLIENETRNHLIRALPIDELMNMADESHTSQAQKRLA